MFGARLPNQLYVPTMNVAGLPATHSIYSQGPRILNFRDRAARYAGADVNIALWTKPMQSGGLIRFEFHKYAFHIKDFLVQLYLASTVLAVCKGVRKLPSRRLLGQEVGWQATIELGTFLVEVGWKDPLRIFDFMNNLRHCLPAIVKKRQRRLIYIYM